MAFLFFNFYGTPGHIQNWQVSSFRNLYYIIQCLKSSWRKFELFRRHLYLIKHVKGSSFRLHSRFLLSGCFITSKETAPFLYNKLNIHMYIEASPYLTGFHITCFTCKQQSLTLLGHLVSPRNAFAFRGLSTVMMRTL